MLQTTTSAWLRGLGKCVKNGTQALRRIRPYLASLFALALVGGWLFSFAPTLFAQEINQIALVVEHGDGTEVTQCIEFMERELTGYEVLERSGLPMSIEVYPQGPMICSIDGKGCNFPQESCTCATNQTPSRYWTYWHMQGREWKYADQGAGSTIVRPGEVQGWKWGDGERSEPEEYTFEEICMPAEAEPTATLTPLPSPTSPPTATDAPSSTPTVTPTPTPSFTPSYTPFPTATPTMPFATGTATWTPTPTWTPSMTPTPTWTVDPVNNQGSPLETPTPTITPTPTFTPENGAIAAQPNVVQGYALLLPVVQAPLPTVAVAEIPTEVPTATPEPTPTPLPTDTPLPTPTPEVVALVVTEAPTALPEVPTETPTEIPVATVIIVVTAETITQAVAPMPTNLTAMATPAPAMDSQMTTLLTMLIGAGMLVVLPMGLLVVAGLAYWIGRKL